MTGDWVAVVIGTEPELDVSVELAGGWRDELDHEELAELVRAEVNAAICDSLAALGEYGRDDAAPAAMDLADAVALAEGELATARAGLAGPRAEEEPRTFASGGNGSVRLTTRDGLVVAAEIDQWWLAEAGAGQVTADLRAVVFDVVEDLVRRRPPNRIGPATAYLTGLLADPGELCRRAGFPMAAQER